MCNRWDLLCFSITWWCWMFRFFNFSIQNHWKVLYFTWTPVQQSKQTATNYCRVQGTNYSYHSWSQCWWLWLLLPLLLLLLLLLLLFFILLPHLIIIIIHFIASSQRLRPIDNFSDSPMPRLSYFDALSSALVPWHGIIMTFIMLLNNFDRLVHSKNCNP